MTKRDKAEGKVLPLTRRDRKCPLCGRAAGTGFRPFCSKRCADLDLGRWLGDGYRIPGDPAPLADDGAGDRADDRDDV